MKVRKFLFGLLAFLPCFTLIYSCNTDSNIDLGFPDIVGGDDRDDEWYNPWGENDKKEYVCEHKCLTCGKCLNPECKEEVCKEKCFETDSSIRKSYEFKAVHDYVRVTSGTPYPTAKNIAEDCIGNFSQSLGAKIEFAIESNKEAAGSMSIVASLKADETYPASATSIYINEERFMSKGFLSKSSDGSSWVQYGEAYLGCITLLEGINYFTFEIENADIASFNFRSLKISSDAEISIVNLNEPIEVHECESPDPLTGKCTDYDCNKKACLDKVEIDWKNLNIYGKDDEVVKVASDGKTNLWNDKVGEECIGYINGDIGCQIVWAFTATEETYLRLVLEHSTNGTNDYFTDMWDLYWNDKELITQGQVGAGEQSWTNYAKGTVAYVKATPGLNQFRMYHKISGGYNLRSLDIYYQTGEISEAQAHL